MKGLLFTYGLTYGGAAVAIFNPWYGLLAYITFAILRPETLWFWSVSPGNYQRTVAIAVLVGWAINGFGNWQFHRARPIVAALAFYWLWIIVSAAAAPNQQVAWAAAELQSKIILPVLVGFTLIDSIEKLKQLAWVVVLCLGYVGFEANLDHYGGGYRLYSYGYFGVDNNSATIALVTGAGVAFFLGLRESMVWRRWLCFGLAACLAHCPMIANSRGGMLGLIACGVASFVVVPKTKKNLWLMGVASVFALSLAGPPVIQRFSTTFAEAEERDESADSRVELWGNCWDAMQRKPLTGLGPDHFPLAARDYYGWGSRKESHTLWLNVGAELGFPGLLALAVFYGLTVQRLWALRQDRFLHEPWLSDVARMVIASMAGFTVSAMFVALDALEVPLFVALLGGGGLKVAGILEKNKTRQINVETSADEPSYEFAGA